MLASFENLLKILNQEEKSGLQNKAVIGGLEQLTSHWVRTAYQESETKAQRLQIEKIAAILKAYNRLPTVDERQTAVNDIRQIIWGETPTESAPAETAETAETTTPAAPPPPKPARKPPTPRPLSVEGLSAPITRLPGIKDANAAKLEKLGVQTIGDLLSLYPRRYDDYRNLKTIHQLRYGEEVTIIASVWQTNQRKSRAGRSIVTCILSDGTGTIEATWFNQPWLEKKLAPNRQIVVSGKVDEYLGRLSFQSPEWEYLDKELIHTGRLVPVYPLTAGITAHWLRRLIKRTVDYWAPRLPDHLPDDVRERLQLLPLTEAVQQIHFPDDWQTLEAARRRLAFDELLLIQLGVFKQRQEWKAHPGTPVKVDRAVVDAFLSALPFSLTGAQQRALDEILADIAQPSAMSRLLQGDVGSGKTVVALAAMLAVIADGGQAAILAPTEILAEQHYNSMRALLKQSGHSEKVNVALLTGSTKAAERKPILAGLADGSIQLLVGTHAIIQKNVVMHNLRLAVVDEQHRFGVEQRGLLRQKGTNPHMLVMSATPIPRSLALTMYGDLDLSIIDEMPAGRQEIKTVWLAPTERERAYRFVQSQIDKGRQAFIICPLVEESDKIEAKSAIEEHRRLQKEVFPNLKLGLLHGRMKAAKKEAVMADFRDGKTHILVSTSVVEVGIDIPNASIILIEGANRFGLAQLHQFRGRVGRGAHQSYCILLSDSATPEAEARLKVMEQTNNGFELAEEDLKLRGPGEFFGTKQSGLPSLKLVKLTDTKLLEMARDEAKMLIDADPLLEKPEHKLLAQRVNAFWQQISDRS